jgi:hypothetical protein
MPRSPHSSDDNAGRSTTVRKTVTSDRARQGHWGGRVLLILALALMLAAALWIGVELYGQMIEPPGEDLPGNVPG